MRQIIVAVIFISAAIGVFWGWTMPMLNQMKVLQKDISDLNGVMSRFYDLRQIKNDLTAVYNSISSKDYAQLNQIAPNSVKESDLIVEFEGLASANTMVLKRVDIKPTPKEVKGVKLATKDSAEGISINLVIDGSYASLKSFLRQAEDSLRVIDVRTLSFLAGDKDFYEFNVTAEAYFQK
ncbi:MAG: hypothetical protein AAB378_02505 [Patescibacteria group bacterium]